MQWGAIDLLRTLLAAAVGFILLIPVIWILQRLAAGNKRKAISKVISFSVCLFCAMWSLRLGLECFTVMTEAAGDQAQWYEALANSMLQTLEAFGGDKEYTKHLLAVRQMIEQVTGNNDGQLLFWNIWVTAMEFLAPIASGAIILEALVNVFPRFKLWLLRRLPWKTKMYFSQLNEGALTLAESIMGLKYKWLCKPVIIFANAELSELPETMVLGAKHLGAFCLAEDIYYINKKGWGKRKFFLIGKEPENLQQLVGLSQEKNSKYLMGSEVYLFCQSDAYTTVEQSICEALTPRVSPKAQLPVIIPVRPYRNLVVDMLIGLPLYEPLLHKAPKADGTRDLTVTILGTGTLGTEMFLNTYWIGQILDCNLTVNLVSREPEESFWGRIDALNPEIRHTMILGDKILRVDNKGHFAQPYCTVNYYACDIRSAQYTKRMHWDSKDTALLDTDYFVVALGTDTDNIEQANYIRRAVEEYHVHSNSDNKTVITYVVYDSDLASALNEKTLYTSAYKNGPDIYMQAVGTHEQVYSAQSVFLTQQEPLAQKIDQTYLSKQSENDRAKDAHKRLHEDYNHWSNRARAAHRKYKIFSLGVRHPSVFDLKGHKNAAYLRAVKKANDQAADITWADTQSMSPQEQEAHTRLMDRMAWLEHRRWNAFLRVYGFRGSEDYRIYGDPNVPKSYKSQDMKLHPCLVECNDEGIRLRKQLVQVEDKTKVSFVCDDPDSLDLLDALSCQLADAGYNDYDFKVYDYPDCDFSQPEAKKG